MTCRSARNNQYTIKLVGTCFRRSFKISRECVTFPLLSTNEIAGAAPAALSALDIGPHIELPSRENRPTTDDDKITIMIEPDSYGEPTALEPLRFGAGTGPAGAGGVSDIEVLANLVYFNCEVKTTPRAANNAGILEYTTLLVLSVNRDAVFENFAQLFRRRHLTEQVVIYSRRNPAERGRVMVSLFHGFYRDFLMSPWRGVLKDRLADIESRVVGLISQFMRTCVAHGATGSTLPGGGASRRNSLVQHRGVDEADVPVWSLNDPGKRVLLQYLYLTDELKYAGLESHSTHDYLFGTHLAHLLFTAVLESGVFQQHAPAMLSVAFTGARPSTRPPSRAAGEPDGRERLEWPDQLQPWLIQLYRYLAACTMDTPPLVSLHELADRLFGTP